MIVAKRIDPFDDLCCHCLDVESLFQDLIQRLAVKELEVFGLEGDAFVWL